MNPKRNTTCTRGPWSFSSTSGSGIKGSILTPTRFRDRPVPKDGPFGRQIMQKGQLYGHEVTETDYDKRNAEEKRLGLLYGYTQYYGRNTCEFVMSRAARKHGVKPPAGWKGDGYRRRAAEGKRK